ncbi:hypothetical protein BV98_002217 [Sphingobium herbicidovorans NBRC 16415]|uniref:Uncharacterized protein n=1 Tax=Sphingobium herbicidovorans (strain ATCC 700291 / DSM 11019 / CCUG 56400 / KCTC 2939 / LMG 18315 / NBRC 16415 / MH) TaxID=1219045 RepID=A0A086P9H6_SPHHM|nr:hypothetical protein [Sphingobium herbicidovorans]KFG90044.1 hypothetical protein BV98_002217 [Sphingobium herbicidovorans NBRC 16415]
MGIFEKASFGEATMPSPVDQAREALEAIDFGKHIDRRDSLKLGIASKEAALNRANARLDELRTLIREQREPDGEAVAHALLSDGALPPATDELEREKEQILAGTKVLVRQINDGYIPLRGPWDDLKKEIEEALEPVIDDLAGRAQGLLEELEALYAASAALRRLVSSGKVDQIWRLSGTLLSEGHELPRTFALKGEIPVEPALLTLNQVPGLEDTKLRLAQSVRRPTTVDMRRY